ncbi:MAG: hypothetical protein JWQ42_2469 [Edaphobacter sp.]|nr:hypothetical protein [Edaphobacter sp.]
MELKKSSTPLLVIIALQLLAASLPVHEWLKRELFVPVQLRNISSKSQLRAPHPLDLPEMPLFCDSKVFAFERFAVI